MTDASPPVARRTFVRATTLTAGAFAAGASSAVRAEKGLKPPAPHPLLTPADGFYDVSRGTPKLCKLTGEALVKARLTPETWRLKIMGDPLTNDLVKEPAGATRQFTLALGNALDLPTLMELGKKHSVRYLPRPILKAGKNEVETHRFEVV